MTDRLDDAHVARQRSRLTATEVDFDVDRQRAMLVGVNRGTRPRGTAEAVEISLAELALLTDTAGSDPVESIIVNRRTLDPATFIGSGKAAELAAYAAAADIDVVIFDDELTPAQQGNLKKVFGCDVVDRIAVILDIFAQHATTSEGMIQVELAQHRYRLPRLRGRGVEMSRLGGGIGTRGPGETQLETDRRRILDRMKTLERRLKGMGNSRKTRRTSRARSSAPTVSLVGYTNAGKSSLFNTLTGAEVLVRDQLFATLASTVRKLELADGHEAFLSDTVGFVRRLPHELVEAFRATLEEVAEADLLLHVVDAADADPDGQIDAVRSVLGAIGAAEVTELLVINKADIASTAAKDRLRRLHPDAIVVSAVTGEGCEHLKEAILEALARGTTEMELFVPYDRGDVVNDLHDHAEVATQEHLAGGTHLFVRLPTSMAHRFDMFLESQDSPTPDR